MHLSYQLSLIWSKDHQVSIKAFCQLTFSFLGWIVKQCQYMQQTMSTSGTTSLYKKMSTIRTMASLFVLLHLETSQSGWGPAHQSEMANVSNQQHFRRKYKIRIAACYKQQKQCEQENNLCRKGRLSSRSSAWLHAREKPNYREAILLKWKIY